MNEPPALFGQPLAEDQPGHNDPNGKLGLESGVVRLVPYQSAWSVLFEREASRLREVTGNKIGRIEHMGSTAIPGMEAKPILDLMAEVETEADGLGLAPAIETLGYEFRPDEDVPGRLYFRKRLPDGRCTHHLSLTERGSEFSRRQILFRDYLRSHARLMQEYLVLKRRLAARFRFDRESYIEGKTEFVKKVHHLADVE